MRQVHIEIGYCLMKTLNLIVITKAQLVVMAGLLITI